MSDIQLAAAGIKEQYAAQVAEDLRHNLEEQERIVAEAAALEKQLRTLRRDHELLTNVQQALGGEDPATGTRHETGGQEGSETGEVPKPQPALAEPQPPSQNGSETATAAKAEEHFGAAAQGKPAKAVEKTAGPTLVSLVRDHLAQSSEPRSAAEVAAALAQSHPDRNVKTTVIRTTLEGLVAKGQVQRTKQGASVFYAAPVPEKKAAQATGKAGSAAK